GSSGSQQTQLLLQGAASAASLGIRRVIWPIRVGSVQRDFEPGADLDTLAAMIDRAVLAGRLASLDARVGSGDEPIEMTIETPLVDFSNAQLADLAGDLSVSLDACWWAHDRRVVPSAQVEYDYWSKLSVLQRAASGASFEVKSLNADSVLRDHPLR
ncbi:MAG: hypothetical protein JKY96_03930, partial [Phycisphaerales bacterium]|nr:hypothetical protein [Phycisphaerales bacterium]